MQYRPAQLRTKNIHGILTMFMFAVNMLDIDKLVLSCNKRHQISCAAGSSTVTISHLLSMDRITQIASSSKQPLLQKYDI